MNHISITLEARNPSRNLFRSYHAEISQDLFGDWLLDITYGRIGTKGHTIRQVSATAEAAKESLIRCLKRRKAAPKKYDCSYKCVNKFDPESFIDTSFLQS